jgi:choline kinase
MRAILLAAGRGRRLGADHPKCLLEIEGKTLLARHVANLLEGGVTALTVVVGFQREKVYEAARHLNPALPIDFVENDRFVHGSIVSLGVALDRIAEGGIWMDADVLYPAALLRRLVASKHDNCVLIDTRADESGEEMMIGIRDGRALKIARRVGRDWDTVGESVGFFKVGPEGARVMKQIIDGEIAAGRLDQEYEAAIDRAFQEAPFGFERVDDFSWTEIDFEEDVERARALVHQIAG